MGWTVYACEYETGELSDTSLSTPVKPKKNTILRAARTKIVYYNNPSFTSLNMKIYSSDNIAGVETPVKLLHTSTDSRTKAEIVGDLYGIRSIYFTFDDVVLQKDTFYNFVLNGSGYSPVLNTNYLAWIKAWPDPAYQDGFVPSRVNLFSAPFHLELIGSEL